jgi:cyclopropane-fatty-acyl-phospholipid synthase
MRLLSALLRHAITAGDLTLIWPDGATEHFGGAGDGPRLTLRVKDPAFGRRAFIDPELGVAEGYMDGKIEIVDGALRDLFQLYFLNQGAIETHATQKIRGWLNHALRRLHQHNPVSRSGQNVRRHYDIGEDLYRLFLDRDMQYSCAYFPTGNETLEEAQTLKKRHIAAKLMIRDGQRVLDIGCGWGGMALYLAHLADVEVTGITLSENQLGVARRRAEALGVADRVRFELRDYREVEGAFDRIVSVGMLEHVGAGFLGAYFRAVRDRLNPDGAALIHSISTKSPPGPTSPFLRKYIFPGGYPPTVSETATAIEEAGLWLLDCEILRVHYGHTLREWAARFAARRDEIVQRFDERFARMWEFYLIGCETTFTHGPSHVFQAQLGRARDAAPLTRDYIVEEEDRLAALEPGFVDRVTGSAEAALDAREATGAYS